MKISKIWEPGEIKKCTTCGTTETPQWYTGQFCKACYRKSHREKNLETYKKKDAAQYEKTKDRVLDRMAQYYIDHKEERAAYQKKYYEENGWPDRNEYQRNWCAKNPEKVKATSDKYKEKYPDKLKEAYLRYQKKNLSKYAARAGYRRAQKLKATPRWLSEKQKAEIIKIYETCPKGWDVDHIYPLINELSCGLHVPWNLQHLPRTENRKKSNKLPK